MKHLRKSILTLLALTLFGGAGAWAQGQLLTTINASSSFTNGTQTFDNIVTVTLDDASYDANVGWFSSGSPRPVGVAPVNGVTVTSYMLYFSSSDPIEFEGSSFTVALEGDMVWDDEIITQLGSVGITKIEVYGTAPAQEIELTKAGANQWTLGQTPDYDLELQVEYYQPHALKDIPAGWTVLVNGVDKTSAIAGDSLMITETDSVTLIPDGNPRRVKSVTLEDEAPQLQSLQVGGVFPGTFYYLPGETWEQALQNHPTENNGWSTWYIYVLHGDNYLEYTNSSYVNHTDPIDPTAGYLTE